MNFYIPLNSIDFFVLMCIWKIIRVLSNVLTLFLNQLHLVLCALWIIHRLKLSIAERKFFTHTHRHIYTYKHERWKIKFLPFIEFYYWDSYWIIEGLLLCDMNVTAKGMIENFLSMVKRYGFVPNGGRVYYLSRSQPPMLISMVCKSDDGQRWTTIYFYPCLDYPKYAL